MTYLTFSLICEVRLLPLTPLPYCFPFRSTFWSYFPLKTNRYSFLIDLVQAFLEALTQVWWMMIRPFWIPIAILECTFDVAYFPSVFCHSRYFIFCMVWVNNALEDHHRPPVLHYFLQRLFFWVCLIDFSFATLSELQKKESYF